MVKAVDMTGKSCQNRNTGHSKITASISALPCETKYQAAKADPTVPPNPPTPKKIVMMTRETTSILPRVLRRRVDKHPPAQPCDGGELGAGTEVIRFSVLGVVMFLTQPGKFLLLAAASDDAEEDFFQRQLLGGCGLARRAVPGWAGTGSESLGFDSGAQFFQRALSNQPSVMNDGDVAA